MKWDRPSETLSTLIETNLEDVEYDKRKMFGQVAYFIKGNMFTGVFESSIFLRFSVETKTELMKEYPLTTHFEPRKGMAMKEYLVLSKDIVDSKVFPELLSKSIEYVSGLPEKKKKERKK